MFLYFFKIFECVVIFVCSWEVGLFEGRFGGGLLIGGGLFEYLWVFLDVRLVFCFIFLVLKLLKLFVFLIEGCKLVIVFLLWVEI